jgi:hypothetical protein
MEDQPRETDKTAQKIKDLLSFSEDVIASITLAPNYNLKNLAYDIDYLFGQRGTLVSRIEHMMPVSSE